jgi:hypothetical protein
LMISCNAWTEEIISFLTCMEVLSDFNTSASVFLEMQDLLLIVVVHIIVHTCTKFIVRSTTKN